MKSMNLFDFKIELPEYIVTLINTLNSSGYEAYVVGGCVRDCVMGRTPNDFDMTTSATPSEMLNVFRDYKVIETGLKHGTLTVISDNIPVEITTYRVDGEYHDSRHPDSVYFTRNIKEDLSRRDFTVNAMAYNDSHGLVDFYGGFGDIEKKKIIAVGDADKRFKEDALRIMRSLRFASSLGFEIEKNTASAARKNAKSLTNVSAERINVELKKLLQGENAVKIISEYSDILAVVSEEIFASCHTRLEKLSFLPSDLNVFFAFLLSELPKSAAQKFLSDLKFSNAEKDEITKLLSLKAKAFPKNKTEMKKMISESDINIIPKFLELSLAVGEDVSSAAEYYREICENEECVYISDLRINGDDIAMLGIQRGAKIGIALKFLLNAVINGEVENEKEALLNLAKKYFYDSSSK